MSGPLPKRSSFPQTNWRLVKRVAEGGGPEGEESLNRICQIYWPPIYAFIRSCGYTDADAEDLTQSFFSRFLSQDGFSRAEREQGRLRTYLRQAVRNHLASERRRSNRQKRGGDVQVIQLDPEALRGLSDQVAADPGLSPDRLNDRIWATRVLEVAYQSVEATYEKRGKAEMFRKLSPLLRTDAVDPNQDQLAGELGVTPGSLRVALYRLRSRYRECLRERIAETLDAGDDPEEELRELMASFA